MSTFVKVCHSLINKLLMHQSTVFLINVCKHLSSSPCHAANTFTVSNYFELIENTFCSTAQSSHTHEIDGCELCTNAKCSTLIKIGANTFRFI